MHQCDPASLSSESWANQLWLYANACSESHCLHFVYSSLDLSFLILPGNLIFCLFCSSLLKTWFILIATMIPITTLLAQHQQRVPVTARSLILVLVVVLSLSTVIRTSGRMGRNGLRIVSITPRRNRNQIWRVLLQTSEHIWNGDLTKSTIYHKSTHGKSVLLLLSTWGLWI